MIGVVHPVKMPTLILARQRLNIVNRGTVKPADTDAVVITADGELNARKRRLKFNPKVSGHQLTAAVILASLFEF